MLIITVPANELWDSENQRFINIPETTLELEHSLVSLQKWESKWKKPFLDKHHEKTNDEILDYIQCMIVSKDVNPYIHLCLTSKNLNDITAYIQDSMTATWFSRHTGEDEDDDGFIATAEVIYSSMIEYNIPSEYRYWHLSQLLTLIRVRKEREKTSSGNKESMEDARNRHRMLNAQRRALYAKK